MGNLEVHRGAEIQGLRPWGKPHGVDDLRSVLARKSFLWFVMFSSAQGILL
jgi:hypothetical protein